MAVCIIGTSQALFCLVGLLAYTYAKSWKPSASSAGGSGAPPPGPMGLPLLGYLPFLGKDATVQFARLRARFGDLFTIAMGSQTAVIVNGLRNIKDVLHSELASDRPQLKGFSCINEGKSVSFANYGPAYRLHRKICVRALSDLVHPARGSLPGLLRDSGEMLRLLLDAHVDGPFDPLVAVETAVANVVFSISFGAERTPESARDFHIIREELSKFESAHKSCAPGDFVPALQPLLAGSYAYFLEINQKYTAAIQRRIDEHQATYEEGVQRDGVDALIHSMACYRAKLARLGLGEREILHSVQDFVGAGTENMSITILWILQYLARHPRAQADVHAEIERHLAESPDGEIHLTDRPRLPLTWSFIYEVMRVRHSAPLGLPRAASADFLYEGHRIAKGTIVIGNLASVFMDEDVFPEPTVFKPRRFIRDDGTPDNSLLNKLPVYGVGKRRCLGQQLAQNELFYFTAVIVRHFVVREDPAAPLTLAGQLELTYKPDPFTIAIERRRAQAA